MMFNNYLKYRNIAIILCNLLAINILSNPSDRVLALEETNIHIAQNKKERSSIEKLIEENLKAYQKENINALMASIHPRSPVRKETEELSKMVFSLYDLEYEYSNLEILELSGSEATIQMTQTTKKIKGSDFRDNRVTSIQTLKKDNGQWKFFDLLAIKDLEYLN